MPCLPMVAGFSRSRLLQTLGRARSAKGGQDSESGLPPFLAAQNLQPFISEEALVRSLAKVGIIALVDEATGFQEIRARNELQRILERTPYVGKLINKYIYEQLPPGVSTNCRP